MVDGPSLRWTEGFAFRSSQTGVDSEVPPPTSAQAPGTGPQCRCLVARDAWTWPELAQMNESFGPLEAALMTPEVQPPSETPPLEASGSALPVAGPADEVKTEEVDNVTPPVVEADPTAQSVSSSTTSSSASDCSAMGSDLEGVLAEEAAITEAKWFVQSRRVHIVSCRIAGIHLSPKTPRARARASDWLFGASFASDAWHACHEASMPPWLTSADGCTECIKSRGARALWGCGVGVDVRLGGVRF